VSNQQQSSGKVAPVGRHGATAGSPDRSRNAGSNRAKSPRIVVLLVFLLAVLCTPAFTSFRAQADAGPPASTNAALKQDLHRTLATYLRDHGAAEHVSAAGLTISLPGHRSTIDVSAGTTRFGGSRPVSPNSVWQIGSNTKALTSVLILQLEAERRLSINDTLGKWLPQYPQWRGVSIKQLLNMTSGIPGYDEQPAFLRDYAADPRAYFSPERLVSYAIGMPPTSGFSYSNTNYVLAEMVIERVTRDDYQHQLYSRIIRPLRLHDVYYRAHLYPRSVTAREPAGYFYIDQIPSMASFMGSDVSRDSMSWARGAGGILATTSDMTHWERALYTGRLLPPRQQRELTGLVSRRTGQLIDQTSPSDPSGFGLGVDQATTATLGTMWLYEGGTLGFRALHVYFPRTGVILALTLNSQASKDDIFPLAETVYDNLRSKGIIR
jgi:D-alanyl-D-alanine carboxypeptidase